MANQYVSWAGKAPTGHHLDVIIDDKVVQKWLIDEKDCYFFGWDRKINDFCDDRASCSRIHGVLLYHKHLKQSYLVDFGSCKCSYSY